MAITIRPRVKIETYGPKMAQAAREASREPLLKAGAIVRDAAKGSMRKAPSPGVPSPPGTPPHIQTGNLHRNIKRGVVPDGKGGWIGWVGWTKAAWYGVVHEYGGRFHPQRAFLIPALRRISYKLKYALRGGLKLADTTTGKRLITRERTRSRRTF